MLQEASFSNWREGESSKSETVDVAADEVECREKPHGG